MVKENNKVRVRWLEHVVVLVMVLGTVPARADTIISYVIDSSASVIHTSGGLAGTPIAGRTCVVPGETCIGGDRKGWNGRGGGRVAIAVEHRGRTAGSVGLVAIPRATSAVWTSFIHGSIVPEAATVQTDALQFSRESERNLSHPLETSHFPNR